MCDTPRYSFDGCFDSDLNAPIAKFSYERVLLPSLLVELARELNLTKRDTQKSLQFLDILITFSLLEDNQQPTNFVYFSSSYFRQVFTSKYRRWLIVLLQSGVVETDGSWSTDTGKSLNYRISPELEIDWRKLVSVFIKVKNKHFYRPNDANYFKELMKFYGSIEIDSDKLIELANKELKKEKDPTKRTNKRTAWVRSMHKLDQKSFYAKRNNTNNRLDTNFTNLPKALMNEIKAKNGLLEIDAVNSQPAILANLIKDEVNDDYVQDAINGQLYERVAEEMKWSRDKTKHGIMVTFFSPEIHSNNLKSTLIKLYPETMRYIDDFKSQNGYRELAISMQKKESALYIDGVLDKVYSLGIIAISKHDSIIFHSKDQDVVEKVFIDVMNKNGFELKRKIS